MVRSNTAGAIAPALTLLLAFATSSAAAATDCPGREAGTKQLYWGDLHVHSGYSLDAWGYGTADTPESAYAFGRGEPVTLAAGMQVQLERPLDFMAVTDHAEWFALMYLCTDPTWRDDAYCEILTTRNAPTTGSEVFAEYVIPTITKAAPAPPGICEGEGVDCAAAQAGQWRRIQVQANAANDPCEFTTFVAFEWSGTPDFSHNHRNVIFATDTVTREAIDYLRYPTPQRLWQALDRAVQGGGRLRCFGDSAQHEHGRW